MNIHTFQDAVQSKRASLVHDLDNDDDEEDDGTHREMTAAVEGEEDDSGDRFNDTGMVMEPFHLKNEREGGYFDENQNYVFKKEVAEVDAWVSGLDEDAKESAIQAAAMAESKRLAKLAQQEAALEQRQQRSTAELKQELLSLLLPGETVSGALRRLSGKTDLQTSSGIKRRRDAQQAPQEKPQRAVDKRKDQQETAKRNRDRIDSLTEAADQLLANGLTGIYEMTYEAIYASTVMWEYKGADGKIYGPFSSQEISQWKGQGYLTGPTAVLMRKVTSTLPRLPSVSHKGKATSIYDDEDEEEKEEGEGNEAGSSSPAAKRVRGGGEESEEWVSSDSIDFGVFVNLDQEAHRYSLRDEKESAKVVGERGRATSQRPFVERVTNSHARAQRRSDAGADVGVEDVESDEDAT